MKQENANLNKYISRIRYVHDSTQCVWCQLERIVDIVLKSLVHLRKLNFLLQIPFSLISQMEVCFTRNIVLALVEMSGINVQQLNSFAFEYTTLSSLTGSHICKNNRNCFRSMLLRCSWLSFLKTLDQTTSTILLQNTL